MLDYYHQVVPCAAPESRSTVILESYETRGWLQMVDLSVFAFGAAMK